MICTRCNSDGVLNSAGGSDFWYCRTCKDEIYPEVAPPRVYVHPLDSALGRNGFSNAVEAAIKEGMDNFAKGLVMPPIVPPGIPVDTSVDACTARHKTHTWNGFVDKCLACNMDVAYMASNGFPECPYAVRAATPNSAPVTVVLPPPDKGATVTIKRVGSTPVNVVTGGGNLISSYCKHKDTRMRFDNGPQVTEECIYCGLSWAKK